MKKIDKIVIVLLSSAICAGMTGCADWLRVEPYDKVTEESVFSSEREIQAAHNGLYLSMAVNNLYGRNLTNGLVEILAQRYIVSPNEIDPANHKYNISRYNYDLDLVRDVTDATWKSSYNCIFGTNTFITKLSDTEGVISERKKNQLLGEAYAIRAFLHFDMLRLFGPVYANDPEEISIPYYRTSKVEKRERQSAKTVVTMILADLEVALDFLKDDPIFTTGKAGTSEEGSIDYYYDATRHRRLNYIAVSTLKARVLLYAGRKVEAASLASSLITPDLDVLFPWTDSGRFNHASTPDRAFSTEVLFGIHVHQMYSNYKTYFSPEIASDVNLYASLEGNLVEAFELSPGAKLSDATDYRAQTWFSWSNNGNYYISNKFAQTSQNGGFWYYQPLIRKSELYYILAECEQDESWIKTVKANRNARSTSSLTLNEQLTFEYYREFYGEGQLFFYYKRRFEPRIKSGGNGLSATSTQYFEMNEFNYMPFIPQDELDM